MASYRELVDMMDALVRSIVVDKTDNLPTPTSVLRNRAEQLIGEARRGENRPTAWGPLSSEPRSCLST
jgi:hypothetical protein